MLIFDAHLDLSMNALEWNRDLTRPLEEVRRREKGKTDKATVVAALKQAQASCTAAYGSGQIAPLIENVAHSSLHYGNVITYMRMMGLVPPSS